MLKKPLFVEMLALLAIVGALNYVATIYHLYWSIYEFDSVVHFFAGAALSLFFLWLYFFSGFFNPQKRTLAKFLIISVLGTMFLGVLWEIYELIFKQTMVSKIDYPYDTMMDLTMGFFGAIVACFYAFIREDKIKNGDPTPSPSHLQGEGNGER
jgi:hypothetical protein